MEREREQEQDGKREMGMGVGIGSRKWEQERETQTASVRGTCWTKTHTVSDGCVKQRDRKYQTDMLYSEMDSISRTCRTWTDNIRWMCQTGMDGAGQASLIQRNTENGGNRENRENGDEVDIPNRIQEVA